MNQNNNYTKLQFIFLVLLRFLIGWHILYEGIAKVFNPQWSSAGFLSESQWILSGLADWITSNSGVLATVDFLNTWGLIAIGVSLLLGIFARTAAIAGAGLIFIYYLNSPPLTGIEYTLPAEGNNLVVNKTLIEAVALSLLAVFPTSKIFGFDAFWAGRYKKRRRENKMNEEMNPEKKNNLLGEEKTNAQSEGIPRRKILKALAGLPVAGILGFEILRKHNYDVNKRSSVIKELGLDSIDFPMSDYGTKKPSGELIRVGFIGFGTRAGQLSSALGFKHPDEVKTRQQNNTLAEWMQQEYLNVAITGICDVFDLHAENGLATAVNEVRPGGQDAPKLPVKRYNNYREMLNDKNIDAVIIATPDHHHARIATEAAKAGKHVYCEKSPALHEDELNELYTTIKNSDIVYQLGHQITQSIVFQQAKEIIKRNILGKITLVETTSNRNTANGAWIRNLDARGNPKPGSKETIDWEQWLGNAPYAPFSIDRFYNWTKWFDYDHGMIGQLFTHEYDAVNQLLHIGIPKSVSSSGGIYYWKDNRDMPDSLHCVFEYPQHDLTLLYSGNLASSRGRGRVFMGHDASMELSNDAIISADQNSTRYADAIKAGAIDTNAPVISFNPNVGQIDAVTSASEKYYASRGLTTTTINGRRVDVTHLHLREWLNCIRNGGTPGANIEMAFQEGITCIMAHRSYVEKRMVEWDEVTRKIV